MRVEHFYGAAGQKKRNCESMTSVGLHLFRLSVFFSFLPFTLSTCALPLFSHKERNPKRNVLENQSQYSTHFEARGRGPVLFSAAEEDRTRGDLAGERKKNRL